MINFHSLSFSFILSFSQSHTLSLSLSLSLCQVWQQKNIVEDFIFSLRKWKSGLKTRLLVLTFRDVQLFFVLLHSSFLVNDSLSF